MSVSVKSAAPRDFDLDVLIVGAGPTGLALAMQLQRFGGRFRIIDKLDDRTRESRALAVQARSLELLQMFGLGEALVARGNTSARLKLHLEGRALAPVNLGNVGATDTRFPFILFVSQAETEMVLADYLSASGVVVERGFDLVTFTVADGVECVLRQDDGTQERVRTRFLVGCDGAHSTVRKGTGIPFEGGSYPQDFGTGRRRGRWSPRTKCYQLFRRRRRRRHVLSAGPAHDMARHRHVGARRS